jgi:hypothetical protein
MFAQALYGEMPGKGPGKGCARVPGVEPEFAMLEGMKDPQLRRAFKPLIAVLAALDDTHERGEGPHIPL